MSRSTSPYDRAAMRRAVSLTSPDDGEQLAIRVYLATGTVLSAGEATALARELVRAADLLDGSDSRVRPARQPGRSRRRSR